jgi:hypothetical protein
MMVLVWPVDAEVDPADGREDGGKGVYKVQDKPLMRLNLPPEGVDEVDRRSRQCRCLVHTASTYSSSTYTCGFAYTLSAPRKAVLSPAYCSCQWVRLCASIPRNSARTEA